MKNRAREAAGTLVPNLWQLHPSNRQMGLSALTNLTSKD
jgi:hypothetical protein